MQLIPLTNDNDQTFSTILNGQQVRIRATWQDQGNGWFFSLLTTQSEIILANTRIKSNFPVINFKLVDFEGDFVAVPTDVSALEPGRNAWNNSHTFVYLDPTETGELLDALISEAV